MSRLVLLPFAVCGILAASVWGYSSGGDGIPCQPGATPGHGVGAQSGNGGHTLSFSPALTNNGYEPGTTYTGSFALPCEGPTSIPTQAHPSPHPSPRPPLLPSSHPKHSASAIERPQHRRQQRHHPRTLQYRPGIHKLLKYGVARDQITRPVKIAIGFSPLQPPPLQSPLSLTAAVAPRPTPTLNGWPPRKDPAPSPSTWWLCASLLPGTAQTPQWQRLLWIAPAPRTAPPRTASHVKTRPRHVHAWPSAAALLRLLCCFSLTRPTTACDCDQANTCGNCLTGFTQNSFGVCGECPQHDIPPIRFILTSPLPVDCRSSPACAAQNRAACNLGNVSNTCGACLTNFEQNSFGVCGMSPGLTSCPCVGLHPARRCAFSW
jgi:hypothetical protein